MAKRLANRLSARTVATLSKPGRHADGAGLYLVVDTSGAKRWVYLYRQGARLRSPSSGCIPLSGQFASIAPAP